MGFGLNTYMGMSLWAQYPYNNYADIVGVGDICVESNMGCTLAPKDVQQVKHMHSNMISMHALDQSWYGSYFGNEK